MMITRRIGLALIASAMVTACGHTAPPTTHTAYLVRHAEKMTGENPSLTPAGEARALALITALDGKPLTRVFSTDYARTRQTAAPIAATRGLDVEIYDAGDLPGFAARIQAIDSDVLIVGHSNTTPELVDLLGGDGDTPIVEATEYDRIYILRFSDKGTRTRLDRYGN